MTLIHFILKAFALHLFAKYLLVMAQSLMAMISIYFEEANLTTNSKRSSIVVHFDILGVELKVFSMEFNK